MEEVDAAKQAGEDAEEALGRIRRRTMETRKPGERHWHFPPRGRLRQFRELPPPPSFVRR
jgi:hypothetical protein